MPPVKPRPASLAGLTVKKGEAAPVSIAPQEAPQTKEAIVPVSNNGAKASEVKITAITVKLKPDQYRELRMEAIDSGKTNQDIMVSALGLLLRTPKKDRYKKD
jgi:hypothetical protein